MSPTTVPWSWVEVMEVFAGPPNPAWSLWKIYPVDATREVPNGVSVDGSVVVGDAQIFPGNLESYPLDPGRRHGRARRGKETMKRSASPLTAASWWAEALFNREIRRIAGPKPAAGWVLGDCCDCCSVANGVSADGSVVVGRGDFGSGFEAFRWTSEGGSVGAW